MPLTQWWPPDVNRDRPPSGPFKVSESNHTKTIAGIKVVNSGIHLDGTVPGEIVSKIAPVFIEALRPDGHTCDPSTVVIRTVKSAMDVSEDIQEKVAGSLSAVRFLDNHAVGFDPGVSAFLWL